MEARRAEARDRDAAVAVLTLAFAVDPAMRFMLPTPESYRAHAATMIDAGVRLGLELYTRHGFEAKREGRIAEGVPLVQMVRDAR